jgi:integrase
MAKKQKSGLYRSKVTIGKNADGKPIYKYISGTTKKELESERQRVIAYYVTGTGTSDQLFGEYAQKWFKSYVAITDISVSRQADLRVALNKHIFPAFGDRNLRAITSSDLRDFVMQFKGMSDTTLGTLKTVLTGIFRSALSDGIIQTDPTVGLQLPRAADPKQRRALTEDEESRLKPLMNASTLSGMYLSCLYYLGCRPGEARGLMWGDFDWTNQIVHIRRDIDDADKSSIGELKTAAAYRDVPVPDQLCGILYPMRGLPSAFLFVGERSGKPWSHSVARDKFLEVLLAAGLVEPIEHDEEFYSRKRKANGLRFKYRGLITPYYLRHNYITMCWRTGIDPLVTMRIVGHKDYSTTINIYTHLGEQYAIEARPDIDSMFTEKNKVAQKLQQAFSGGVRISDKNKENAQI